MPIVSFHGPEAIQIRKKNSFAAWGNRNEANRIEPITAPAFKVPFRLQRKEPIFTIGSCFARYVETELSDRGFRIPIRDLFRTPEFKDLPNEIVNNFGTPSIYNELAWAFGAETYDEQSNIVEVGTDKFIDLHMVNSIRPAPRETVVARREALLKATRTLADCRVLIMTLGLVELWWDDDAQCYLNTAPLPSLIKRWPRRFSLHVLSFEECFSYLRSALDIAFAHAKKDLSVLLTVSPVPMMLTHRDEDVVTANCYSKSVLRAVAEQLAMRDERVTYFPSYETVTLSDRRFAWTDDFVHVTPQMIALNVDRMVEAFTGKNPDKVSIIPDLAVAPGESADALFLAEEARTARLSGDSEFFDKHGDDAATSPAFALQYAKFLFADGKFDQVLELSAGDNRAEMISLSAKALVAMDQPGKAIKTIRPLCLQGQKSVEPWRIYADAALAMRSKELILQVEIEWKEFQPRNQLQIGTVIGRALRLIGEYALAHERLAPALARPDSNDITAIESAFALMGLDRPEEARRAIDGIIGGTEWRAHQLAILRKRIDAALS